MNPITNWLYSYYDEVSPYDFYRSIFPAGELQQRGVYRLDGSHVYKYNGIAVSVTKERKSDGTPLVKRYTVTDDLNVITDLCKSDDFCLMSPISYIGKTRTASHARYLYAVVVDLDHIKIKDGIPIGIRAFLERHVGLVGRLPKPTYLVSSGTGVHVYYVLDDPIPMYSNVSEQLQLFKRDLTEMLWHETIVDIKDKSEIQQEGIYQGFRIVGTVTKNGDRVRAFQVGNKVSVEYLNSFISDNSHKIVFKGKKGKLSFEEAKEKYPDWIPSNGVSRGTYPVNRNLYLWWKRKISGSEVTVGHRYYCMRCLAIYAVKCSIYDKKKNPNPVTYDELEKDMWELFDHMESLTDSEDNHFQTIDVQDALESFDPKWITYSRRTIEFMTGIVIPPNKRNNLKQVQHLYLARSRKQAMKMIGINFKNPEGRPCKKAIVKKWRQDHPAGNKAYCINETHLDRKTVSKYWNEEE